MPEGIARKQLESIATVFEKLKAEGYEVLVAGGRTYAKAPAKKKSSGGGGGSGTGLTKEEKEFQNQLNKQRDSLAKGGSWATAWNTIKGRYPDISNEELDQLLNKEQYYSQVGR
jgi:hypothetical protein